MTYPRPPDELTTTGRSAPRPCGFHTCAGRAHVASWHAARPRTALRSDFSGAKRGVIRCSAGTPDLRCTAGSTAPVAARPNDQRSPFAGRRAARRRGIKSSPPPVATAAPIKSLSKRTLTGSGELRFTGVIELETSRREANRQGPLPRRILQGSLLSRCRLLCGPGSGLRT